MVNPLEEASPKSLEDVFNADPLELTRQDRDVIVAELRRMREVWVKAEAGGAKRAPKASAAGVSLSDLGL
jgi:hypothetical protein